jgi:hypothetical protein
MRDVILRLVTALVSKGVITVEEMQSVSQFVELDIQDRAEQSSRFVSPRRIKCKDNDQKPCVVITSTREQFVSIRVEGGDGWAHITKEQAVHLANWLIEASK